MNKGIKRMWGISEVGFFMMSSMETMFLLFFLTDVVIVIASAFVFRNIDKALYAGIAGPFDRRAWYLPCS